MILGCLVGILSFSNLALAGTTSAPPAIQPVARGQDWFSLKSTFKPAPNAARTCWVRVSDSPTDYTTVQDAIDAAQNGDTIRIAGTCYGVSSAAGMKQVAFIQNKSIRVQGGFTSTSWTVPDPIGNPTTLDAQGQGRVFYIDGRASVTVDGVRITGGVAPNAGGGVFVNLSTVTLSNNLVDHNTAPNGAGINLLGSPSTLTNNTISGNTATSFGGGVRLDTSPAALVNNVITQNTAGDGGGIYLAHANGATLTGNFITQNTANHAPGQPANEIHGAGGVLFETSNATLNSNTIDSNHFSDPTIGYGGGLYLVHSPSALSNNTVSNHVAFGGGGLFLEESNASLIGNAISSNTAYNYAGGVFVQRSFATLRANSFVANSCTGVSGGFGNGGGLYIEGGQYPAGTETHATAMHNTFQTNSAKVQGGGIYLWKSHATLTGNTIRQNGAKYGAGLFLISTFDTLINNVIADNQASDQGGGLSVAGGTPSLFYTTIARNSAATYGNGLLAQGDNLGAPSQLTLFNTILGDPGSAGQEVFIVTGSSVSLDSTLWQNGVSEYGTGFTHVRDYSGSPAFSNPSGGDYSLLASSAAIDRGVGTSVAVLTDLDGHARRQGTASDLGAYEWGTETFYFPYAVYVPLVSK
jgi:hypothetical protein